MSSLPTLARSSHQFSRWELLIGELHPFFEDKKCAVGYIRILYITSEMLNYSCIISVLCILLGKKYYICFRQNSLFTFLGWFNVQVLFFLICIFLFLRPLPMKMNLFVKLPSKLVRGLSTRMLNLPSRCCCLNWKLVCSMTIGVFDTG